MAVNARVTPRQGSIAAPAIWYKEALKTTVYTNVVKVEAAANMDIVTAASYITSVRFH